MMQKPRGKPQVGMHAYKPSTQEVAAGGSGTQGHPQLCGEFKASLGTSDPVSKEKQKSLQAIEDHQSSAQTRHNHLALAQPSL